MTSSILNLKKTDLDSSPEADLEEVLSVRNLTLAYGENEVLREVSFSARKNRVLAIMGPSGCGKSTLLKSLNRSLELNSAGRVLQGSIHYHGEDIHGVGIDPRSVRKAIGIIHQKPVPFPLSILENVTFAPRFFQRIKKTARLRYAEENLRRVGLWDEVKDRLHESAEALSGGQQQRLCLARTLANEPDLILMDEPCSALDPVGSERIEKLIYELKKDYTIIIVTHNVGQAHRVSDDTLFLYEGRLVESGTTERIFASPRTELARGYVTGKFG